MHHINAWRYRWKFVFRFLVVGDVSVGGVCDCVKECMCFIMYLFMWYVGWELFNLGPFDSTCNISRFVAMLV